MRVSRSRSVKMNACFFLFLSVALVVADDNGSKSKRQSGNWLESPADIFDGRESGKYDHPHGGHEKNTPVTREVKNPYQQVSVPQPYQNDGHPVEIPILLSYPGKQSAGKAYVPQSYQANVLQSYQGNPQSYSLTVPQSHAPQSYSLPAPQSQVPQSYSLTAPQSQVPQSYSLSPQSHAPQSYSFNTLQSHVPQSYPVTLQSHAPQSYPGNTLQSLQASLQSYPVIAPQLYQANAPQPYSIQVLAPQQYPVEKQYLYRRDAVEDPLSVQKPDQVGPIQLLLKPVYQNQSPRNSASAKSQS